MASSVPTGLTWVVASKLFGVTLSAQPARERIEHLGIVRPMRLVAFHASWARVAGHRIVLMDEGASLLSVAAHTVVFVEGPGHFLLLGGV